MANTVLITGASRGIGAATARYFGEQGWQVAVHYHEREDLALELVRELREMGTCAVALGADLACPDQASALPARAEEALATLDALVCGAGIALPQQLVTDTSGDEWRRLMGIDLDGVFYTIRGAVPSFVRRRQGAIVTISSMWGTTGASCEAPYSAAKAGVIGLTKALAKELGPSNIRVNCVAPGVIRTDMNRHLSQADMDALADQTPLCRTGDPEEVARAIFFLASEQSCFVTGQVLGVDGGMAV